MALTAESVYFSDFEYRFRTRRFNKILAKKEKITEDCLNSLKLILEKGESHGSISENNLFSVAEKHGITILEYINRKLINWSDNSFDVPALLDDSLFAKPIVFIRNGWFIPKTTQSGNEKIIGLLRVRTNYGFENDLIKNGFEKVFGIPENVELSMDKNISAFHVLNREGGFLFSLIYPDVKGPTFIIIGPLILWISVFVLILLLTKEYIAVFVSKGKNYLAVAASLLVFSLIYFLILYSNKPAILFQTELFSPYRFTLNDFVPSLGHLFLISILLSDFSYIFLKYFPLTERSGENASKDYFYLTCLFAVGVVLFLCFHWIFSQLISNSNINFETFKILEISVYSVIGFATLILLLLVPLFFLMKVFSISQRLKAKIIIFSIITSLIVLAVWYKLQHNVDWPLTIFYILIAVSAWLAWKRKTGMFSMTVVFSLIFGLYSLYYITFLSEEKVTENLKVLAVSYSNDNDPTAEHLLLDMWPRLSVDTALKKMMQFEFFGKDYNYSDKVKAYLLETYFNGYWDNFNYNIVLCRNDSRLIVDSDNNVDNCFDYFEEHILKYGHQLAGTGFYFLDEQGGRAFYLGRLSTKTGNGITNRLYIRLYADIDAFQAGYSELLLDRKYQGYARLKDYSSAKYINGGLVLRTGEFPYDKTDAEYMDKGSDYRIFTVDGYKHVLYQTGNITVLISRPTLTIGNIIISFAYLFAFIFLFSNLVLLVIRRPDLKKLLSYNFRQKLQMAFIGILLFSFVSIGVVVAFLTIRQYQTKHYENVKEKLNSVYLELDNKLSREKSLTSDWRDNTNFSLNELLIKISNVFNTDINLYEQNGHLIATSRPEIFYRDLTSRRMNIIAFINLASLTKSEYIQKEKIGTLEYISVYVPFYNIDNKLLVYVNLPYFRMQSALAREISNLIVAVINFTLLLIVLTMSFAVFISGRLTSPLKMLGSGLASVELGKKSEHLSYRGNDEISELVKQYNRMVDEIEESAHKLAVSEREYAWREMAKQIAHEIKNPLTPMKLNVQQLYKSWKDEIPGFEKKLERFTKNQIEYIDTLSSIASAFSTFAKLPVANPSGVDLLEQIKTTLELFKNTENTTFRIIWPHESKIYIYADKEQLNGIFSNLIKNGIQSVPAGRQGLIKISLNLKGNKVIISISDNGTGIPEESKKKLFMPNFTTKSSGMGLGLSIVKRYVENANGKIWFDSEPDKGSVFFIELPLKYTVEKLG